MESNSPWIDPPKNAQAQSKHDLPTLDETLQSEEVYRQLSIRVPIKQSSLSRHSSYVSDLSSLKLQSIKPEDFAKVRFEDHKGNIINGKSGQTRRKEKRRGKSSPDSSSDRSRKDGSGSNRSKKKKKRKKKKPRRALLSAVAASDAMPDAKQVKITNIKLDKDPFALEEYQSENSEAEEEKKTVTLISPGAKKKKRKKRRLRKKTIKAKTDTDDENAEVKELKVEDRDVAPSKPDAGFYPAPPGLDKKRCFKQRNCRPLKCSICQNVHYRTRRTFRSNLRIIGNVNMALVRILVDMRTKMVRIDVNLVKVKKNLEFLEEMYETIFRKINRLIP